MYNNYLSALSPVLLCAAVVFTELAFYVLHIDPNDGMVIAYSVLCFVVSVSLFVAHFMLLLYPKRAPLTKFVRLILDNHTPLTKYVVALNLIVGACVMGYGIYSLIEGPSRVGDPFKFRNDPKRYREQVFLARGVTEVVLGFIVFGLNILVVPALVRAVPPAPTQAHHPYATAAAPQRPAQPIQRPAVRATEPIECNSNALPARQEVPTPPPVTNNATTRIISTSHMRSEVPAAVVAWMSSVAVPVGADGWRDALLVHSQPTDRSGCLPPFIAYSLQQLAGDWGSVYCAGCRQPLSRMQQAAWWPCGQVVCAECAVNALSQNQPPRCHLQKQANELLVPCPQCKECAPLSQIQRLVPLYAGSHVVTVSN